MYTKVELSWLVTYHINDIIKLLSTYITCSCGVFIPVSNGVKIIQVDKEIRVIFENQVAAFLPDTVYII